MHQANTMIADQFFFGGCYAYIYTNCLFNIGSVLRSHSQMLSTGLAETVGLMRRIRSRGEY